MESLARYGISIADAKENILELNLSNYYKGPKENFDKKRQGYIWGFKMNIKNIPFYIKLKIDTIKGQNILKILGFHEDEFANNGGLYD